MLILILTKKEEKEKFENFSVLNLVKFEKNTFCKIWYLYNLGFFLHDIESLLCSIKCNIA